MLPINVVKDECNPVIAAGGTRNCVDEFRCLNGGGQQRHHGTFRLVHAESVWVLGPGERFDERTRARRRQDPVGAAG